MHHPIVGYGNVYNKTAIDAMNAQVPFKEIQINVESVLTNVFDFIIGFSNGTSVIHGDSFVTCSVSIKSLVDQAIAIYFAYQTEFARYENF